jgi:hypothetical protein
MADVFDDIVQARKAPAGKYRVLAVDTWNAPGDHWVSGDYDDEATARARADMRASYDSYTKYYVYDDQGAFRHEGRTK